MPKKQVITKSALAPTVLISGGAGFIGSHLAEYLLENKARVVVLDNFNTGKEIHVKHLLSNDNFALYDVDINEGIPPEVESVDYIFHLAGLEEYFYSKEYLSLDSLLTNSLGTKNLLDLAKKSSAKFLLASTIDVYQGRLSQLYLDKYFGSSSSDENRFSLIEAKRFAEAVVWEYFKKNDSDVRIVRLPEVYGPRMDLSSSGFLGGFISNVLNGSSIEIYGDGVEKDFYLYISDVVSGLIKAQFNPKTKGNIYSLIPDDSISALESAYIVRSLADSKLPVQFKPGLSEYSSQLKTPDTFNMKDLNWRPKVGIKEGVSKTLESFGYSINTYAFKPLKLVEQKIKEKKKEEESSKNKNIGVEKLTSLQGIKVTSRPLNQVLNTKPSNKNLSSLSKKFDYGKFENAISSEGNVFKRGLSFFKKPVIKNQNEEVKSGYNKEKFNGLLKVRERFRSFKYEIKADIGKSASVIAVLLSAFLVFVCLPAFSLYMDVKKGYSLLDKAKEEVMQIKSEELEKDTLNAFNSFRSARMSIRKLNWLFSIAGKKNEFNSYDKLLGSLTSFSRALNYGSGAVKPLESVFETIRPDNPSVLDQSLFETAKMSISNAKDYFRLAEADAANVDTKYIPEKYRSEVETYKDLLLKTDETADDMLNLVSNLPQILGSQGERKYIFWFQNSNEIRPTGGFIGSYGVLTLESGKLKNLIIDDIYNPDGQIDVRNIKVDSPEPIKKFLGEDVLYLRNSNWDPDFTKSSKTFDDLYFKVTGENIDGYIALDLKFVESLLKVTGPVFLAPYNEDISAGNLEERAQYYSGFDYKDGSTDKKSFLTVLGGKLLERIFSFKKEDLPSLIKEVQNSLDQRHLEVHFSNSSINNILKEKNWDGSLVDTTGDYLLVNNANLGGTKANYYVKNKMTYEINSMTRDGLLRANLYLDYSNTAETVAWPGGPYTDYVRVLTRSGSKLTGAKIAYDGGVEQDIFKDVVISKVGNKNSFETSFKLDPKSSVRLILSYDLSEDLSVTKNSGKYNLYWQKQSGTFGDEYHFTFNPPFGSIVEGKSDSLGIVGDSLKSNGVFERDLNYYIYLK